MKDLISNEEAKAIRLKNERAVQEITSGFDLETMRRQFDKKRYGKVKVNPSDTTIPGEHTIYEAPLLPLLDKDNALKAFWKTYKGVLEKKPILTDNNIIVLEEVILWLIHEGPLNANKGLFIFGDFGRGKTDLIKTMFLFSLFTYPKFRNARKLPLAKEYKFIYEKAQKGAPIKGQYMIDKPITIDDIGFKEESTLNLYGNKKDIVTNIIYARHSIWKRDIKHTSIFTSNLYPEDVRANHGEGVSSRLKEMCNLILWDGNINLREI